jgi:uncharacterized membrane protein
MTIAESLRSESEELQEREHSPRDINVNGTERLVSGGLGAFLVVNGLKRLSLGGLIEAGIGAALVNRAVSGHCFVYQAMGVDTAGEGAPPEEYFHRGIHVEETFIVNKPAEELYAFWRNFENLPKFMSHVESVTRLDPEGKRTRWVAKGPAGVPIKWDAEIINEEPNRLIAWRSLGGTDVDNAGSVRFIDACERGTVVNVVMDYIPPAGRIGALVAKLFGRDAEQLIRKDLRQFKQLVESGELPMPSASETTSR